MSFLPSTMGCEDYTFLTKLLYFDHGIDSMLTDLLKIPYLDASIDEPVIIPSLLFSGYLCPPL